MSRSRSEAPEAGVDPLRPADYAGGSGDRSPVQPRLGPVGWLRFIWRQLTSMRTALALLLLLALAAIPGSLVPQRSSNPNGVIQYQQDDPEMFEVLDALGLFSTFESPWFSAIYLLLFVSLIGCILPRARHHLQALRARPPRTPARLTRLAGFRQDTMEADPETAVAEGTRLLRRLGYRVERYDARGTFSVSAERGYLRETGNLIFHSSLVGVLIAVGIGGGLGYSGQRILVQDTSFTNNRASYDSFNPGRFFADDQLAPFSLRLDDFIGEYEFELNTAFWHPVDFVAEMSVREPGGDWRPAELRLNDPLPIGDTQTYLLGNGFAPVITIRDPDGVAVSSEAIPFRPQDGNLFSLGVVKVADGLDEQVGMVGIFAPDAIKIHDVLSSFSPDPHNPVVQFEVYTGDLGLDDGVAVNVYTLDTDDMEPRAGREADEPAIELAPGQSAELPGGLGTVEFTGLLRFVSVEIHHDPSVGWVLGFSIAVLGGLLLSLFVPRRRVWIKATAGPEGSVVEYAGLARGEDPRLEAAVRDVARAHRAALGESPLEEAARDADAARA